MMVEIRLPNFQEWKQSPEAPIQVIFIFHLVFSSWSMLGGWSGNKLLVHDTFFLLSLLWCLHNQHSSSPLIIALAIDVVSVLLDIIVLATAYPHNSTTTEEFSAVMAIFNLILRLISIPVLWRSLSFQTDGDFGVTVDGGPPSGRNGSVVGSKNGSVAGYGYSVSSYHQQPTSGPNAPPRQELPAIPPTYVQHQ